MSVFTTVNLVEVQTHLQNFSIGEVIALKGIAAGVTNTNYFVTTANSKYVLTIFEENEMADLPYFVDLMAHLAKKSVLCPMPISDKNGVCLHLLKGKPALMVSCLNGTDTETPSVGQCEHVGHALAKMHLAGQDFKHQSHNLRDVTWRVATAAKVMDKLPAADQDLLKQILAFQENFDLSALPHGVIHGDLFRDNVLFDGEKLGGFIDFYYACNDVLAFDVAVAVNDWCLLPSGDFDEPKLNALMQAYTKLRPFNEAEQQAWQGLLCIAALRFWLSRLYDWHFPHEGEMTHAKDPDHFKRILQRRATPTELHHIH
ncbi:MAG: homoserine kinase [Methylophilaceae bacterium]